MLTQVTEKLIMGTRSLLSHRLTRHVGHLAAGQYTAAALNLATTVVLARLLGPSNYGLLALVLAYPTLLWSFASIKSVSVTTRYISVFREKGEYEQLKAIVKVGYGIDFIMALIVFVIVTITSWWVSQRFYKHPDLAWLMVVYAASFPVFSLTSTSWAVLSSWERFQWLAILEIVRPFVKFCLVLIFLLVGLGVPGAIVGMALAQVSIGLAMMLTTTGLLHREIGTPWWKVSIKAITSIKSELLGFFGWNYLSVTLSGLLFQIPVMLLGRLRSPEEAGFYRLAVSIQAIGKYLETALKRVTYPVLSARWVKEDRNQIFGSLIQWTIKAGVPVGIGLVFFTITLPWVISWVFGNAYRPAALAAQVIMSGLAFSVLFFWLNPFYYATGNIGIWVKGYTLYTLMIVGMSWFIVDLWGFVGLAWLMTIGSVLFTLFMLLMSRTLPIK